MVQPMAASLARREVRARPGRFGWLVLAVTVAVGFTVGAFGFSTQLTRLLDRPDRWYSRRRPTP